MRNKKAFTVVELVIVIAIIAILAAVLIPTFANIIKKANTSKDNQLIRNLNTALATSRAENNNEPHANMTEALAAAEKFGYEVDKINASGTDAEILWDSQNDLFCYFDGSEIKYIPESELIYTKDNTDTEKRIFDVDYWVIRKDVTNTAADNRGEGEHQISAKYSTYLAGLAGDATIVITKGLDVGNNTISSIQYNNTTAQRVSIRTNGGTLEVNAPNDTVNHFGDADSVKIIDVKSTSSYHEFGTVPFIQIKSGRLVLEKTADVNGIHLVKTLVDNGDNTTTTSFDNIVLNFGGKTVKLTRDPIGTSLGNDLMLVCKVEGENGDDEYIWLKGNGTFNSENVFVSSTPNKSDATMITESSASYAAKAVANYLDGSNVVDGKTADEAKAASALKGSGTADDPFLIYDYATMQKISDFYDLGSYHFKVALEKTDNGKIDCKNWIPVDLYGFFNGSGVEFINLDNNLFSYVKNDYSYDAPPSNATVFNFTINNPFIRKNGAYQAIVAYYTAAGACYFKDININGGYVEGTTEVASFLAFGPGGFGKIYFNNCNSSASIASAGDAVAGFVAKGYAAGKKVELHFIDSFFTGTLACPSSARSGYFHGADDSDVDLYTSYSDYSKLDELILGKGVEVANRPTATTTVDWVAAQGTDADNYWYRSDRVSFFTKTDHTEDVSVGSTITVNQKNSSASAIAFLFIGPNDANGYGNYVGIYMSEDLDISQGTYTTSNIKKYTIKVNDTNYEQGLNSEANVYNVVNSHYGVNNIGSATIVIIQYDVHGLIVAIDNWNIK